MAIKNYEIRYKIENIVLTAKVHTPTEAPINLVDASAKIPLAEYNPDRFPGVVLRIEIPRATILLFSTRKCVITGVKKIDDINGIKEALAKLLAKAKIDVTSIDTEIVNIVASGSVAKHVDLNLIAVMIPNTMYEPEVFPGAIIRLSDPKAVFLLFSTGSTVCAQIRDEHLFQKAHELLRKLIVESGAEMESPEPIDVDEEEMGFI